MLKKTITNFQNSKSIFQDSLIILCLLSFFFSMGYQIKFI